MHWTLLAQCTKGTWCSYAVVVGHAKVYQGSNHVFGCYFLYICSVRCYLTGILEYCYSPIPCARDRPFGAVEATAIRTICICSMDFAQLYVELWSLIPPWGRGNFLSTTSGIRVFL
jgi:hypothetical protein